MSRELQALNTQSKLSLWAERIADCRNSSLTVRDWCRENKVSQQTYYKWQRRVFDLARQNQPQFAEVSLHKPASGEKPVATLKAAGLEADIYADMEEQTLTMLCRVLRHAE